MIQPRVSRKVLHSYCFQTFIEVPRHASKILANVKKEDKKAEKRALNFIAEGAPLRKAGTIEKKDLSIFII